MDHQERQSLVFRLITQTLIWLAVTGTILFAAAGTIRWPQAWIYLALWLGAGLTSGLSLLKTNPEIIKERLRPPLQQQQKRWDRPLLFAIFGSFVLLYAVAGLDTKRLDWSDMPVWLEAAGGVSILFGIYLFHITLRENAYASAVVKVDAERGHKVISTGPYAWVRHPMYSGAIFYCLGTALLLGSWAAFGIGMLLILIIAVRAVWEEQTLMAELTGYSDYARFVKYRLLPGLW